MKRGFVTIVFIIGCATGGVASQLVVPPVRAGTAPTRWEYLCNEATFATMRQLRAALNEAGDVGWEAVSVMPMHQDHSFNGDLEVDAISFCAKRALP